MGPGAALVAAGRSSCGRGAEAVAVPRGTNGAARCRGVAAGRAARAAPGRAAPRHLPRAGRGRRPRVGGRMFLVV